MMAGLRRSSRRGKGVNTARFIDDADNEHSDNHAPGGGLSDGNSASVSGEKNSELPDVVGLGEPRIISNTVIAAAKAIRKDERKRKLEEEENELRQKLQRVQAEKTRLESEQDPINPVTPPGAAKVSESTSASSGEVRLQPKDLVDAMSAAFAQALKFSKTKESQPGLVSRLTSNKEALEFSGNSLEWRRFKRAFDQSTESGQYSDQENVSRLYSFLRGDARKAVESLMLTSESAQEIMNALELLYGGDDRILKKLVDSLRKLPRLNSGEFNIVTFASHVKNNVTAIQSIGDKGYLTNPDLLQEILQKLPEAMILNYNEYIARFSRKSDLTALADFLNDQAKIANLAGTTGILSSARRFDSDRGNNRVRRLYAVESRDRSRSPGQHRDRSRSSARRRDRSRSSNRRRESLICSYCRTRDHDVEKCREFQQISFRKRWEWAKRAKCCFKCLKNGHIGKDCRASGCRVSGCKYQHHKLLHKQESKKSGSDTRGRAQVNTTNLD